MTTRVVMVGGPWDGNWCTLTATPPRVQIGITLYRRLDDPDTGEFLGGYIVDPYPETHHDLRGGE
jgi:hypothetical protein